MCKAEPDSAAIDRAIFQRLFSRMLQEAEMLLLYGAMPVEIDEALIAFGFGEGVFELQDRVGTDIEYQWRKQRKSEGGWPAGYMSLISDRMVEEGRLGRQSVVGWYRYPGGKGKVEDPLIEDLVAEESHFACITRYRVSADEIISLLLCALVDEAALLSCESRETNPTEIDRVSINMLAFPAGTGGICQYLKKKGAEHLLADYDALSSRFSWLRKPEGLLQAV